MRRCRYLAIAITLCLSAGFAFAQEPASNPAVAAADNTQQEKRPVRYVEKELYVPVLNALGLMYARLKHPIDATRTFEKVIALQPDFAPAHFNHGWASEMSLVAERHPGLTMIIDHLGLSQSPVSPPRDEPWDKLDGLLGLAQYPNVHVKLCGVPLLSSRAYPYPDVWPYLHQVFEAFGPERVLWASDFTRMRWLPTLQVKDTPYAPFKDWKYYSDCLNFLRDTNEISESDKEWVFGKTVRRVLRWPD